MCVSVNLSFINLVIRPAEDSRGKNVPTATAMFRHVTIPPLQLTGPRKPVHQPSSSPIFHWASFPQNALVTFTFKITVFVLFFGRGLLGFVEVGGLSLVAGGRGYSSLQCAGFPPR